jgi:hypothetical protein
LETRLLIAYGLLTGMIVALGVGAAIYSRRRVARRRRLRGIKDYNTGSRRGA